jgi:hypothetical protein
MKSNSWFKELSYDNLKKAFKIPPKEFSILPFWSWNDTLDPDKIRFQIDEMLNKGISGAFIHARAGIETSETPYFSEGWWKAIKAAIEYGSQKKFFSILYDEDKWPSGAAGGRVVAENPIFAKVGLKVEKWEITGKRKICLDFSGDIITILAAKVIKHGKIDPESIINLSSKSGQLWTIPEGNWCIAAFIKVKDSGIQIDYLNKEAVSKFIEITHKEYYKRFDKFFGTTVPGIFFDEIYAHIPNADFVWSRFFLEDFERIKGYDLKPFLLHLIFDTGTLTPKVRCDYFDVFTTLYTEAWFKQIALWCQKHNIWLIGHTIETIRDYYSQGNYFSTWTPVQIPGTDNEDYRYTFPPRIRWFKPKQHSSLCHLYNKKRAAVEAMGGGGWVMAPEEYKIGFYMLGVYGLNLFIPHLFHYSTDNSKTMEDWPPSWFYRNPYWKYFNKLANLASRVSFMGSQGNHVCDVGILYPITSLWAQHSEKKEDVGTLGGGETGNVLEIQYNAIQETLLDNLIDFDIIDPESIIKSDFINNKLKITDESYSVIILPPVSTIRRSVIEKVKAFFNNGGTVIAFNTLPTASMEKGKEDGFVMNACKEIFGFDPRSIRIGYFEIDEKVEKEYITNQNTKGGKAYFTKWIKYLPEILSTVINRDIIIVEGNSSCLRILHRRTEDKEIYFLVNELKSYKTVRISFRQNGKPELWNPETGELTNISNYIEIDERTEIPLTFLPMEGYYIVFTQSKEKSSMMISRTNLYEGRITKKTGDKVFIDGWIKSNMNKISATLENRESNNIKSLYFEFDNSKQLSPINLNEKWMFIVAPNKLDYQWLSEISSSEIKIPIFKFHPEQKNENGELMDWHKPDFNDSNWKNVKIKDSLSKDKGCKRYFSTWDASWINYYRYYRHWGTLGNEKVDFRRVLSIEKDVESAWICITADKSYEFFINSKKIGTGSDWKKPSTYQIDSTLKRGKNIFLANVNNCKGLLVQGEIKFIDGTKFQLLSDNKWEASVDENIWLPAFSYIYPPLGPWDEIAMNGNKNHFPATLWYRQILPPGSKSIKTPVISGEYKIFINGQLLDISSDEKIIHISEHINKDKNILAIKVNALQSDDGIIEPVTIICEKSELSLGSWTKYGLDWYSGRVIYSKEFDLPSAYIGSDRRLFIELGNVCYCCEIWINNNLIDYKMWPPYSFDITQFVHEGKNSISIVVANLLANQMQWNIYDDSLTVPRSRFVHEGAVFRQPDRLESGLLGPVTLIPYHMEKLEIIT